MAGFDEYVWSLSDYTAESNNNWVLGSVPISGNKVFGRASITYGIFHNNTMVWDFIDGMVGS